MKHLHFFYILGTPCRSYASLSKLGASAVASHTLWLFMIIKSCMLPGYRIQTWDPLPGFNEARNPDFLHKSFSRCKLVWCFKFSTSIFFFFRFPEHCGDFWRLFQFPITILRCSLFFCFLHNYIKDPDLETYHLKIPQ